MRSSLGLQGDLDDVELIEDVEEAFGLRFWDAELTRCRTVGDLFELVQARLPSEGSTGNCATAMAFYRLRRAIQPHVAITLRPNSPIAALNGISVRELHRIIKEECGLRPPLPYVSILGCIALALIASLPLTVIALGLEWWIAAASALLACGIYRKAPIRLPDQVTTFGDLVRVVSSRSVGALMQQGARLRATEAWDAFGDILSDHTLLPKDAIVLDTLILRPKKAVS